MGKRKQGDFQKTKLKVGRRLPKGLNETNTSFHTRKINLQEQIKATHEEPTLKELLSFMKSKDVKIKFENLRKLHKFVSDNEDTLSMFFPDVLKELGSTLQESEPSIRSEAISVLGRCAEILTDTQLESFVAPLTSYLNCMMTHVTFSVKQDALKFLDVLLKSHSSVICQSYEILFSLLKMISSKGKGGKNKIKVTDFVNSKITAQQWRMDVLKRILTFLNEIVPEKNSTEIVPDDEKKVYWDAKEALYLPLYINGGVEPVKFDYSLYCPVNLESNNSPNFKNFTDDLINCLSATLKGMNMQASLNEVQIDSFCTITQILCCIGKWAIGNLNLKDDLNPAQSLTSVCCQLLRRFPYTLQSLPRSAKIEKVECIELNMEICYLYCMCSLLSDSLPRSYLDKWQTIADSLAKVFCVSGTEMNEKGIVLALKITRVMMQSNHFDEDAKKGMLIALILTLETNKFTSSKNDLFTFFMELSLNYDYKDFLNTPALNQWFDKLIGYLSSMVKFNVFVPNFLNYLRQICARRNKRFMIQVNSSDSDEKFIELLKFDDEDLQLTIIHLIVSRDEISPEFLQGLAETIRDPSISLKAASTLIRMLHSRFSKSGVPRSDKLNFIKFLLNLGCDSFLILDPSQDIDPLPLTDMLLNFQQSFSCRYQIYPTSDFERQKGISEVCVDCLTPYLRDEINLECTVLFIRTIFAKHVRYPVHSMVAVIELFKRFNTLYSCAQPDLLQDFIFSCLLYNSLITADVPEDHWIEYCVPAVQECLGLVNASHVISCMDECAYGFKDHQLHHALRIITFLMGNQLLNIVDKNRIYVLLNKLRKLDEFPNRPIFKRMMQNICHYLNNLCEN